MKAIILGVLVLIVAAEHREKIDPWSQMPASVMVDDRRNNLKIIAFDNELFWKRLSNNSLVNPDGWR